jgi:hypothetical protein
LRSVVVIELADVFRRFADGYLSAHGATMPASHRRAIADILACRTEALGGHLWRCDQCSHEVFSYHSCKNRCCPKCHTKQTKDWLDARKTEMLPTDYFHVTITVPEELRALLRANQRDGYALLMKAADAVRSMMAARTVRTGTASNLLGALAEVAGDRAARFRRKDGRGPSPSTSPPLYAGKRRGATVRIVRVHAKIQFRQRLRGRASADGSQRWGR